MKDYNFRGKRNFQYCEWNNKKRKDCANNNRYDKKTKKILNA